MGELTTFLLLNTLATRCDNLTVKSMYNDSFVLRVLAYQLAPWIQVLRIKEDGTPVLRGVSYSIFVDIMNALKLRYKLILQKDQTSGMLLPNGSWTGMIRSLTIDAADMTASPLCPSYVRVQAMDFTNGYYTTHVNIIGSSPPPTLTNVAGLITVFHGEVWIALFVSMVVLVLVSCCRVANLEGKTKLTLIGKDEFYFILFSYVAAVFLEGTPRSPSGGRSRLMFGMWWLLMVLLGNAFCGLFRASMMAKKEGEKVQNLDHLATLTHRITPYILKNSAYEQYFRGGDLPVFKKILSAVIASNSSKPNAELYSSETIKKMTKGEVVIMNEQMISTNKVGSLCTSLGAGNFYEAKEVFYTHDFCFGLKKNFYPDLLKLLDTRVRWFAESGIPQKMLERENRNYEKCSGTEDEDGSWSPLSIEDVKMIMFFVLIAAAFSTSVLGLELLLNRIFVLSHVAAA